MVSGLGGAQGASLKSSLFGLGWVGVVLYAYSIKTDACFKMHRYAMLWPSPNSLRVLGSRL